MTFATIQKGDRISFEGKHGHTITRTVQGVLADCCAIKHGGEYISVMKSGIKSLIPKGRLIK